MLPSQAGAGNDINAGSPGSQKAPTRSPASPGAIRPGSTLIEEIRFGTVSPPEGVPDKQEAPEEWSEIRPRLAGDIWSPQVIRWARRRRRRNGQSQRGQPARSDG